MQIQKFGFFELIFVSVISGAVSLPLNSVSVILWVAFQNYFLYNLSFSGGRVPKIDFCICNVRVHFPDLGLYMRMGG